MVAVGLLAAALAAASPAVAAGPCTDSWLGGDGGWFVASNWSSGAVPGPSDAVCITAPGSYTVAVPPGPGGGHAGADTLELGAGSGTQKLVIEADTCGDGTGSAGLEIYGHGGAATAAGVGANGQVQLTQLSSTCSNSASTSYLRIDDGVLSNAGLITTDSGGADPVTGRLIKGSIANAIGTIQIGTNTTWTGMTFDNAGALTFSRGSVLTVPKQSGATITNDAGGTIGTPTGSGHLLVYGGNTFQQGAGTANPFYTRPGANPAVIVDGGTLAYTGDGRSNIEAQGGTTLVGDVPSQALLAIECTATENAVLHASSFTNAGFIGLYGDQPESCVTYGRSLSVDASAGPGTGTLTNTGQIRGYGTIDGNVNNTAGSILPGDEYPVCHPCFGAYTPGVISVTGNYTQGSRGALGAVNDCSPCIGIPGISYSRLSVQGDASLDGVLFVLTARGASPAAGDAYEVLTARSVTGRFAPFNGRLDPATYGDLEYLPVYNPGNVTVVVVKLHHNLTVAKTGTGSGAVTSSPAGIDCGTTCTASFSRDQAVTLTPAPAPAPAPAPVAGSTFAGWSGAGCAGTGTCTVRMSADQTVRATFNRLPVASVPGRVGTLGAVLKLTFACEGVSGQRCDGQVTVTALEKLSANGKKVTGVMASKLRTGRFRTVLVAKRALSTQAGHRAEISIRLNHTGQTLRHTFKALPATVKLTQAYNRRTRTIRIAKVTFGADPPRVGITQTKTRHGTLTLGLACHGARGQRCEGAAKLTTFQRLNLENKTITLAPSPSGPGRLIGIGGTSYNLRASSTATITVNLNHTGKTLLGSHRRVPATLTITLRYNRYTTTATTRQITFKR